jgi:hypothetical protein
MAAGPEPSRNAWARLLPRSEPKYLAPPSTKTNDGENAIRAASRPPPTPPAA